MQRNGGLRKVRRRGGSREWTNFRRRLCAGDQGSSVEAKNAEKGARKHAQKTILPPSSSLTESPIKKEAGDRCKDSSYTKMRNSLLEDGMTEIFIPQ
jgi:hypothetical protein